MFRFFLHCLLSDRKGTLLVWAPRPSAWMWPIARAGNACWAEAEKRFSKRKRRLRKPIRELFGGTPRSRGAKKTAIQKCAGELAEHLKSGGESGIRTHVTLSSKHAFQ